MTSTQKELQELKQEVEQHKVASTALRQQLERTQQQLGQTQQEFEQRQRAADTERQQLEQAPQYAPLRYAGHEAGDFLFVPTVVQ